MSLNQSRSEKNESQYRKSGVGGRSGNASHQRSFTGGAGKGGGGGSAAPPFSNSSFNRSFKKSNNAQGGQSRPSIGSVNTTDSSSASGIRPVQNGGHVQSSIHGVPAHATAVSKSADTSNQKPSRAIPRAPASQSSAMNSDSAVPATPTKGDTAKGFSLQFGSISPGFMNGMQIPARTSSAPPNLDEQKRNQALLESSRAVPAIPVPSAPKPQIPKKDAPLLDQPSARETPVDLKPKRDVQVTSAAPPTHSQKPSVIPMSGVPMPMSFHQAPVPMQFGGPNPQIQSQGVPPTSLQMPMQMPLQMGSASQNLFVPGLQHHFMQTQGFMHQGQNLGFNPQLGPQLHHQLGNMGVNGPPPFTPQQTGKVSGTRKTVKITHPETHEELRLDKRPETYTDSVSSGSRSHHSGPPQSQPVHSYTPAQSIGYYHSSYSGAPPFSPAPSSLPLTSAQLSAGPQAPRFNYSVSQVPQTMPFTNQSAPKSFPVNKGWASTEPSSLDQARDVKNVASSTFSGSASVIVKPAVDTGGQRTGELITAEKIESSKVLRSPAEPAVVKKESETSLDSSLLPSKPDFDHLKQSAMAPASVPPGEMASTVSTTALGESALAATDVDDTRETVRSDSLTEKHGKNEHVQQSQQVGSQERGNSFKIGVSDPVETKPVSPPSGVQDKVSLATEESSLAIDSASRDVLTSRVGDIPSEVSVTKSVVNKAREDHHTQESDCPIQDGAVCDSVRAKEEEKQLPAGPEQDDNGLQSTVQPDSMGGVNSPVQTELDASSKDSDHEGGAVETSRGDPEIATSHVESDRTPSEISSDHGLLTESDGHDAVSGNRTDNMSLEDGNISNSSVQENNVAIETEDVWDPNSGHDGEGTDSRPSSVGSSEASSEPIKTKNTTGRRRKKIKEILQKADAAGSTLDLYMAYKGPEDKKEVAAEGIPNGNEKEVTRLDDVTEKKKVEQTKAEPDDWEDAADMSAPKLESSGIGEPGRSVRGDEDGTTAKKYSRDFLLTFADQCTDLPDGFEITSDVADVLMRSSVNVSRSGAREYSSAGRIVDRPSGGARIDRRGSGMMEHDRWSKLPSPLPSGRDAGMDLGYGSNVMGFRPGPGGNYGVLRNPRAQVPVQHVGGILSGPMHSLGFQGTQRNNSDADRWQRATNFNKGLMPAPQTPMQIMHKAEKKYEVGKVTDEEQAKQRRLKAILNKLTPQNFEKLFEQVKEVNIDNAITLSGVIAQIFDKALMEPTFCEMYANFCLHLASELPDLSVDDEKITFKRLLLNKCQEEFERGEREEEEANKADGDGETKQTEEESKEKRIKARRRMLGNIRLIGELYKKRMLTERIMHECIKKLLGQYQNPDEENIEALCKLMSTIGEMIDHPKAKEHMDAYFDIMYQLSNNMKLSSRVRFMLKDAIDLRKNKWQQRRKVEGPKKIEEVHRDAAQERQGQASRLSRGPSTNSSIRRPQPLDYGPRGSTMFSSPIGQIGNFRGLPTRARGFGAQDALVDDRSVYENRTISVPLPQRPSGEDSITLGPQGGLARGMSVRGQPSVSGTSLADISPAHSDVKRMIGGSNGYGSLSERPAYNSREDHFTRAASDRYGGAVASDQAGQEPSSSVGNRNHRNPERGWERPMPTLSPAQVPGMPPAQNVSSDKVWPEERLRDMSIAAIKEFYSAKDEKEVALCVKELNAPGFHPTVISIWVTDSFERKDMERDMLAKLLVNLSNPRDGMFNPQQLLEGFESVLTSLEETVTDAPKAPEFLGRIFAKVVLENVVSLNEIGQLIREVGKELRCFREAGHAADVLGSLLEMIKLEKGETGLKEIRVSSNLRLEDFRPPGNMKSKKLEMFM